MELFPAESKAEQRSRVKALFASIDMDGSVKTWAERWGLDPGVVSTVSVTLPDGTLFNFESYLRGQTDGTEWGSGCERSTWKDKWACIAS